MRNTLFVLALCVVAILLGLFLFLYNPKDLTGQSAQVAQVGDAPVSGTPIAFVVLEQGGNAQEGPETRVNIAARDEEAFAKLWRFAHGAQEIASPEIDFEKEYVIGVFAGTKNSGGHMIEVMNVEDYGDTRTLTVTVTSPGAGCVVTDALTSPYQLIRVPVSMNYLKAVDTAIASPCD